MNKLCKSLLFSPLVIPGWMVSRSDIARLRNADGFAFPRCCELKYFMKTSSNDGFYIDIILERKAAYCVDVDSMSGRKVDID